MAAPEKNKSVLWLMRVSGTITPLYEIILPEARQMTGGQY